MSINKRKRGKVIIVGDQNQGIYVWRGASQDAMEQGIKTFGASIYPLALSYRVPQSHARYNNTILPERYHFEVPDWQKEGELVENMTLDEFYRDIKPGSIVLCRYNAPLVRPCLRLIGQGKNAIILGRDFASGLIALTQKIDYYSMSEFWVSLGEYVNSEYHRLIDADRKNQAELLQDKYNALVAIGEGCYTVEDIIGRIERVFSDDNGQITMSSVHKAKGAEAERVYILDRYNMPSIKARTEEDKRQELNVLHVAITRSKDFMAFVELPKEYKF